MSRLQPVRTNVYNMGTLEKNNTYAQGLLGILSRNETIAIPKVETYTSRLLATDFTMPLWMNRYIELLCLTMTSFVEH